MAEEYRMAQKKQWPPPKSREVGLFTDLTLYAEALALAQADSAVTVFTLQRELGQRLQKMRLVPQQSERTVERLVREMRYFGWLQPKRQTGEKLSTAPHIMTPQGLEVLTLSHRDPRAFRRRLVVKMQETYAIPGWFVARLWQINPDGQGEVILPAPLPDWRPSSRSWNDNDWSNMLQRQTLAAARQSRQVSSSAFPITDQDWLGAVRHVWNRLSKLQPRGRRKVDSASYSPRTRLTLAMREAGVNLLFDRIPYGDQEPDFPGERPPIYLRTFMGWCPRLETLELIGYTDWHPRVAGRLLFPTSVFRSSAPTSQFEVLREVQNPCGDSLWLHQPKWTIIRDKFLGTLVSVHSDCSAQTGVLYVSLLDVRDEVCRQLRLSALCFDRFLAQAIKDLPASDFPWSIAVETDIREQESGGAGQLRQPVYLDGVPHTLIALARLPQDKSEKGASYDQQQPSFAPLTAGTHS